MSRSCSTLTSDRCPCCCSSSTRCGRPCDFVATPSRSWKCIRISSSPGLMDIPVRNRDRMLSAVGWDDGYFRRILRHFSRSSGYPGVERQFFELSSAHNCECLRAGGARVAGSLLSGDSAPGLPIHPHVTWTYTHLKEATENNNNSHNNSHNNQQPTTNNHNHNNQQPTTNNQQPTTNNNSSNNSNNKASVPSVPTFLCASLVCKMDPSGQPSRSCLISWG